MIFRKNVLFKSLSSIILLKTIVVSHPEISHFFKYASKNSRSEDVFPFEENAPVELYPFW